MTTRPDAGNAQRAVNPRFTNEQSALRIHISRPVEDKPGLERIAKFPNNSARVLAL
jgi:hypothetical protein